MRKGVWVVDREEVRYDDDDGDNEAAEESRCYDCISHQTKKTVTVSVFAAWEFVSVVLSFIGLRVICCERESRG